MKARNEKRCFRPMLEELESRLTPSVVTQTTIHPPSVTAEATPHAATLSHAPVGNPHFLVSNPPGKIAYTSTATNLQSPPATGAAAPAQGVPGSIVGAIDFAPLGTITNNYSIKITIAAQGGVEYSQEFDIGGGTPPATVASLVYAAMPKATPGQDKTSVGFTAQMTSSGTGIIIGSYWSNLTNSGATLKSISISTKGTNGATPSKSMSKQTPASPPPSPSPSPASPGSPSNGGGVTSTTAGTVSVGTLAFTFGPNSMNGDSSLQYATAITLSVDGVTVAALVSAGTAYSQVATDVYDDLVAAGLSDVSVSGGEVFVPFDFSGQPTNNISIQDTASGGSDTLDVGVSAS